MCSGPNKGFPQTLLCTCNLHHPLLCMLCLPCCAAPCCSDKQALDCLKQAGWSVEMGIEVFFSLGMQGGSVMDTRAIEQLYLKYKGAPAAAAAAGAGTDIFMSSVVVYHHCQLDMAGVAQASGTV